MPCYAASPNQRNAVSLDQVVRPGGALKPTDSPGGSPPPVELLPLPNRTPRQSNEVVDLSESGTLRLGRLEHPMNPGQATVEELPNGD